MLGSAGRCYKFTVRFLDKIAPKICTTLKCDATKYKFNISYDQDCEIKRMHFFDKLNKYRKNKTDINREEMVRARSIFKSSVRKFKRACLKKKTNKLINTRYKDAKEYWKLLKQSQVSKSSKSLSADTFGEYFKAINDPQSPFYTPPLKKVRGIMLYPPKKFAFECPSVRPSVCPSVSVSFPGSILSIY